MMTPGNAFTPVCGRKSVGVQAATMLWGMDGVGKKLRKFWVDGGYSGALVHSVAHRHRLRLQVVKPAREPQGFALV